MLFRHTGFFVSVLDAKSNLSKSEQQYQQSFNYIINHIKQSLYIHFNIPRRLINSYFLTNERQKKKTCDSRKCGLRSKRQKREKDSKRGHDIVVKWAELILKVLHFRLNSSH